MPGKPESMSGGDLNEFFAAVGFGAILGAGGIQTISQLAQSRAQGKEAQGQGGGEGQPGELPAPTIDIPPGPGRPPSLDKAKALLEQLTGGNPALGNLASTMAQPVQDAYYPGAKQQQAGPPMTEMPMPMEG